MLQERVWSREAISDALGAHAEEWYAAYFEDFLRRDCVADGKFISLAQRDAEIRSRYLELARARLVVRDHASAALYSKVAIDTLPYDSLTEHRLSANAGATAYWNVPTFELAKFHSASVVTVDGDPLDPSDVLAEIQSEFAVVAPMWAQLTAKQLAHRSILTVFADEGVAVWRELEHARMVEEGIIKPLFPDLGVSSASLRRQYEHAAPSSAYVAGYDLATAVAERIGRWFFLSELGSAITFLPILLLAARLPVDDFLLLDRTSPYSPEERLRRLATLDDEALSQRRSLEVVFDQLDASELGVAQIAFGALERHERGSV